MNFLKFANCRSQLKFLMFYKYHFLNFTKNVDSNSESTQKISRGELRRLLDKKENVIKKQIKSTGPGGQHTNKTQSCVMLREKETNITVKVNNSRDSVVNSGIAKKRLLDKLDFHYNGAESKIAKKIEKIKKQKDRQKRRREVNNEQSNKNSKQ